MNFKLKHKISAATPFISLIVFLILGFCFDKWHPGWIAFLAIPIVPIILNLKMIKIGYPTICVAVYIVIGLVWKVWHPTWIIFLTIPIVAIFFPNASIRIGKKKDKKNKNDDDNIIDI